MSRTKGSQDGGRYDVVAAVFRWPAQGADSPMVLGGEGWPGRHKSGGLLFHWSQASTYLDLDDAEWPPLAWRAIRAGYSL